MRRVRVGAPMRVKLDNTTGDQDSVLVTTTDCEEAREDQSIMDGTCCPECEAVDPFHPKKKGCETCRALATQEISRQELIIGGWDSTP